MDSRTALRVLGLLALALVVVVTPANAQPDAAAPADFVERGYTLKVYDCYRPQRAVDDF